jgi:murein DD-endopeptidase MepM/ murein hydrolase activator NlpD
MRKKISIVIIKEPDGKMWNWSISWVKVKVVGILILLFSSTFLWIAFTHGNTVYEKMRFKKILLENKKLKQEVKRIRKIQHEFEQFRKELIKLATALGIEDLKEKIRFPEVKLEPNPLRTLTQLNSISLLKEEKISSPTSSPLRKGWITQDFSPSHPAVDIAGKKGEEVMSTINGEVSFVGEDKILGKVVKIRDKKGREVIYGHLWKTVVQEGEQVSIGKVIGYVGSTGKSSAPHLHYEVRINGEPINPIKKGGKK